MSCFYSYLTGYLFKYSSIQLGQEGFPKAMSRAEFTRAMPWRGKPRMKFKVFQKESSRKSRFENCRADFASPNRWGRRVDRYKLDL